MSFKKIFIIVGIIVVLAIIPITVMFLQKSQENRSRAAPATTLCFSLPSSDGACLSSSLQQPLQQTAGQPFSLDVMMDPGTNQIVAARLQVTYDPTKLSIPTTSSAGGCTGLCSNSSIFSIEPPVYSAGVAKIGLTVIPGSMPGFVSTRTKIATINFLASSATTTPTQIDLDNATNPTTILPANASGDTGNVLSRATPAFISIISSSITPTATPTATVGPSPTPGPTIANQPPVCTALHVDRIASGPAPFAITFTANGNDTNGTINKVSFDFGDGPVQNITQGGGIGTNTVSVQATHSYPNPGTFTASAVMTDNNGSLSSSATCTQAITVTQPPTATPQPSGFQASPTSTAVIPTSTPTPIVITATPLPPTSTPIIAQQQNPTMAPAGPGNKVIGIGAVGVILSIIGGILLLAL